MCHKNNWHILQYTKNGRYQFLCFVVTVIKIPEVCRHTFSIDKNELSTSTFISFNYDMWKKFSHQKGRTCRVKFVFKQKSSKNVKVKVAIDGEDSASKCLFDVNVLAYKGSQPLQVRNVLLECYNCL